jgi:hypothetical protein
MNLIWWILIKLPIYIKIHNLLKPKNCAHIFYKEISTIHHLCQIENLEYNNLNIH